MGTKNQQPLAAMPELSEEDRLPLPSYLTKFVWSLWLANLVVVAASLSTGVQLSVEGVLVVDGLTLVGWFAVTTISAVVHSYARRYMEGDARIERFFLGLTGFTLASMVFVASDSLVLLTAAWLAMGLAIAGLIGHDRDFEAAGNAGAYARKRFLLTTAAVAGASVMLWLGTGQLSVGGVTGALDQAPGLVVVASAVALVLAAAVQSALFPFQSWLLSSMTAPTPASALMHAGFVNAGGILLARFAPVVTYEPYVMLAVTAVGASSALLGKFMKSVQADIKRKLGCSTVGQMGFMLMQVGFGFFAAAVTHLMLHGFYKADLFLSNGTRIKQTTPAGEDVRTPGKTGAAAAVATALLAGGVFAALTGKGTSLDAGLVLALLVVLTTMHAAQDMVSRRNLPASIRYLGVPGVVLPSIAIYAAVYRVVETTMHDLAAVPAPVELTPLHAVLMAVFVVGYVAVEMDFQRRSDRIYALLRHLSRPARGTVLVRGGDEDV